MAFCDRGVEAGFEDYVEALGPALGHADRRAPFGTCLTGLPLPIERKGVEPMAARVAPHRTGAAHRSLLHPVGVSPWRDAAVLQGGGTLCNCSRRCAGKQYILNRIFLFCIVFFV